MVPDRFHDLTCTACQVLGQLTNYIKKVQDREQKKIKQLYFTFDKIALLFCTAAAWRALCQKKMKYLVVLAWRFYSWILYFLVKDIYS